MKNTEAVVWHLKNKKNEYPIKVRVWENKYNYYNTGIGVSARKMFNSKTGLVRESHPDYLRLNKIIKEAVAKYSIEHSSSDCFKEYLKRHFESLRHAKRFGNANKFSVLYNHLNTFHANSIKFIDITPTFLKKFQEYLQGIGLSANTIHIYLNKFKRVYFIARQEKLIVGENVFESFKYNGTPTFSKAISRENFKKFRDNTFLLGGLEVKWRDENLFLFYANGMRVGDAILLQFKNIIDGQIQYKMRKTGKLMSIRINPDLLDVIMKLIPDNFIYTKHGMDAPIDRSFKAESYLRYYAEQFPNQYILSYMNEYKCNTDEERYRKVQSITSRWNLQLKKLCVSLSIPEISSHQIRHTFATLFLEDMNDMRAISNLMGHSNLKITIQYIKSLKDEQVADMSDDFYSNLKMEDNPIIVKKKPSSKY